MKTFKLILITAIAILFLSCESEQVTEQTCECYKQTWVRYGTNDFYHNGAEQFYSNDCTDDGDILGGYSGQGYDVQYRIDCR